MTDGNITYLIGAGASAEAVPMVSNLAERLNKIKEIRILLAEKQYPNNSKSEVLSNEFKWFKNLVQNNLSPDTIAGQFYFTKRFKDYNRLKNIIYFYFGFLSIFTPLDRRYLNFLVSLLTANNGSFPNNVNIISWNYDLQFDLINYYELTNELAFNIHKLNLNNLDTDLFDRFNVTKLNGDITSYDLEGNATSFHNLENQESQLEKLEILINNYINNHNKILNLQENDIFNKLGIDFSWEKSNFKLENLKLLRKKLEETATLVIIGYSFPTFNRIIDKENIKAMINLQRIYIQDLNPNNIEESLRSLYGSGNELDSQVVHVENVNQFYVPYNL